MRALVWWLMGAALLIGGVVAVVDTHGRAQPPASWKPCGHRAQQTLYCVPTR